MTLSCWSDKLDDQTGWQVMDMGWRARMLGFLMICTLVLIVNALAIVTGHGPDPSNDEAGKAPGLVYSERPDYRWLQP